MKEFGETAIKMHNIKLCPDSQPPPKVSRFLQPGVKCSYLRKGSANIGDTLMGADILAGDRPTLKPQTEVVTDVFSFSKAFRP